MYDTTEDDRSDSWKARDPAPPRTLLLAGVDDDDTAEPHLVRGID